MKTFELKEEIPEEIDWLKEGKAKALDPFKDILPSILMTKNEVITSENQNKYPAFMINRALSYHIDCLNAVQQLNQYQNIPNRAQYLFLINTIRKGKRGFSKWAKKQVFEDIEMVAEYFELSMKKAEEAISCLTPEQLQTIRDKMDKGGRP